jgi:NADPH:quinone reductase-like Zn-dependent oxidoreductase
MNEARPATMRAAVVRRGGGPEVLRIETLPAPDPRAGEVLIAVKAIGLNRSELFTRRGQSPGVVFPRVLGIEATGLVVAAPGVDDLKPGDTVATVMGGMGRDFDGGYADFTLVPATQVRRIDTNLPWARLGALPEMLQTTWGSLFDALDCHASERLLIRGGTTSVGIAAAQIAAQRGIIVAATTRQTARLDFLARHGVAHPFLDDGDLAPRLRNAWPGGADKVLELVGTSTLAESLQCARKGGVVCMSGMVGDRWTIDAFEPMVAIPTGVHLTTYSGGVDDFMAMPFQQLVSDVEHGDLDIPLGPTFSLPEIALAHACMENNQAMGKIVVLP